MGNSDPLNNYLRNLHCIPVELPRAGIKPSQIFARFDGGPLEQYGELSRLFVQGNTPPPPLTENVPAADISGKRSSDLNIELGLSIMGNFLQAMTGSTLDLKPKFQEASTITFEFKHVLRDYIDLDLLDGYLNASKVNAQPYTENLLLNANAINVITVALKSSEFTVEATKTGGASLKLDVPVIQQIVGGNVTISGETKENKFQLTFKGTLPLVFGVQAVQLLPEDGHIRMKPAPGVHILEAKKNLAYLESEVTFLKLKGE